MYHHDRDLVGHRDTINCLAFSFDGAYLASGDDAGYLIIWAAPFAEEHDRYHLLHSITALVWLPGTSGLLVGLANCDLFYVSVVCAFLSPQT